MATTNDSNELLKEAIYENFNVIEYCIKFDKASSELWGNGYSGCLGIPATILLCSVIDTIGSFFRGSNYQIKIEENNCTIDTVSNHFFILNHEKIFNLNLKMVTIQDFYSTYRSKLTHNESLPPNNFLGVGTETDLIFELNPEYKIEKLNLLPLFLATKNAADEFIRVIEIANVSEDHYFTKDLVEKGKILDPSRTIKPSDTGLTMKII